MSEQTNHARFAEFKQQLWTMVNAMERTLRRSHPRVAVAGGQYNEDQILAKLLPEPTGYYVDAGANAPVDCSNTWQFYQRGWRGLLIECLPSAWHALLRQRPGDYLCPLALWDSPGFARLRVANALSSLQPDWDIEESSEIVVECETLTNVLSNYPQIRDNCSLLSVDVEGAEGAVLRGIDWNAFRPKVIVIEAYRYHAGGAEEDMSTEWEPLLLTNGYQLHTQNKLNKVYVQQ